jgi:hypothetical protein
MRRMVAQMQRQIGAQIQEQGFAVVGVPDQLGAYAYTVGLTARGLKELYTIGESVTVLRDDLVCLASKLIHQDQGVFAWYPGVLIATRRGLFEVLPMDPALSAGLLKEAIGFYGADAVSAWTVSPAR